QLEQAAEAVARRAADRAGAEQIAGIEVAATAAVMRDELRHGPIEIGALGLRQALWRHALAAHRPGDDQRLERDIEGAGALVRLVPEIVERPGIIGWARYLGLPERRQRLHRHHPGRDRRCEILGEKGTERLAFPGLHIARRPIVEEAQSDDVVACRRNRNWL